MYAYMNTHVYIIYLYQSMSISVHKAHPSSELPNSASKIRSFLDQLSVPPKPGEARGLQ